MDRKLETGDETITLTDDDGNETEFSPAGTIEVDGREYALLVQMEPDDSEWPGLPEVEIMRIETDDDGADILVDIEDEDEFDRVASAVEAFFEDDEETPRCRICGCTDMAGCPEGCWWVEPDLCSSCARTQDQKG